MLDEVQRSEKTTDGDGEQRGAANGKPGETLFSKAIPPRFRRGTAVEKAKGTHERDLDAPCKPSFPAKKLVYAEIASAATASRLTRWDLIGLDRLTGLINRPITPIDELSASLGKDAYASSSYFP